MICQLRTPTRHVVIVTGSRHWTDRAAIARRLEKYPAGTLVIHGGCVGADQIAGQVAHDLGLGLLVEDYFDDLGPAGGPSRNALLVALGCAYRDHGYCVIVEAFPMPDSRGTWNCTRQAEDARLPVRIERCAL